MLKRNVRRLLPFLIFLASLCSGFRAEAHLPKHSFTASNLTNDGHFTYNWNSENQLTSVISLTNTPANSKRKLTFEYDALGRRIRAGVSRWTNSTWLVTVSNKFVYDGWNLVAELNATNNALVRSYAWGLDLSGSMENAGLARQSGATAAGVGGLLWVNDASTLGSNSTHCVAYDGNGNVTALVDAGSGNETARYEYGPFGETLRGTGLMAAANPFRFSTKYHDDESDLVYYGYRYYSPTLQRWLNRDPLGEEGGLNLYGFVENDPVNSTDGLGLYVTSLNFAPAAELAWMFGGGAAFDAGLSVGIQKLTADPCKDKWLNWGDVREDVIDGALLTGATLGFSKVYELYKAGKLAKLLRGADELRELGRYDELTEMIALHGDEFGDALMAYRRANSFGDIASAARSGNNAARNVSTMGSTLGELPLYHLPYRAFARGQRLESLATQARSRNLKVFLDSPLGSMAQKGRMFVRPGGRRLDFLEEFVHTKQLIGWNAPARQQMERDLVRFGDDAGRTAFELQAKSLLLRHADRFGLGRLDKWLLNRQINRLNKYGTQFGY